MSGRNRRGAANAIVDRSDFLQLIPEYKGAGSSLLWPSWCKKLEHYARLAGWNDSVMFEVAAVKFTGDLPEGCVDSFLTAYPQRSNQTWTRFKSYAEKKFWNPASTDWYYDEWASLKRQQGQTVSQYQILFEKALARIRKAAQRNGDPVADFYPKPAVLKSTFIKNLNNQSLSREVRRKKPADYEAAVQNALEEEKEMTRGAFGDNMRGAGGCVAIPCDTDHNPQDLALAAAVSRDPRFTLRFSDLPVTREVLKVLGQDGLLAPRKGVARRVHFAEEEEDLESKEPKPRARSTPAEVNAARNVYLDRESKRTRAPATGSQRRDLELSREIMARRLDALEKVVSEKEVQQAKNMERLERRLRREKSSQAAEESEDSDSSVEGDHDSLVTLSPRSRASDRKSRSSTPRRRSTRTRKPTSRLTSSVAVGSRSRARSLSPPRRSEPAMSLRSGDVLELARQLQPLVLGHQALALQGLRDRQLSNSVCWSCGQVGHFSRDKVCPNHPSRGGSSTAPALPRRGAPGSKQNEVTCAYCHQVGHHIEDCPDPNCRVSQRNVNALRSLSGADSRRRGLRPDTEDRRLRGIPTARHLCPHCNKLVTHHPDRCWSNPANADGNRGRGAVPAPGPRLNSVSQRGLQLAGRQAAATASISFDQLDRVLGMFQRHNDRDPDAGPAAENGRDGQS